MLVMFPSCLLKPAFGQLEVILSSRWLRLGEGEASHTERRH